MASAIDEILTVSSQLLFNHSVVVVVLSNHDEIQRKSGSHFQPGECVGVFVE